jgi:hypothetical protein
MFQNILDLFLPPTHLSLKKIILLLTSVMFDEKVEIETCLSEHFSKIGTDINIAPGRMEHMSTFVREMENDLSHGDNMFSIEYIV